MPRAYSYVRFSAKQQINGDSLRRQLAGTRAYCTEKGLQLDESLTLHDLGVSAFKGKNADVGALGQFLDLVERGRVPAGSVLVVESLDRLSREAVGDAFDLWKRLLKAGIKIATLTPEREYTPASVNDLGGLLEALIIMYRANEESATKSARVRASWEAKRKKMHEQPATSRCPCWLRLKDDGSGYEVIPSARDAVLRVYALAREGYGQTQITKRMNQEGIPPIGRRRPHWVRSYVAKLLNNRAVLGECQPYVTQGGKLVPAGDPVKGYYPPIMSAKEWYATQRALKSRANQRGPRGKHVRNLFTGLLRDARDGCAMVVKAAWGRSIKPYLLSAGVAKGEQPGRYLHFPYDTFEDNLLSILGQELTAALLRDGPKRREQEIAALAGELEELNGRIKKATDRLAARPDFEAGWEALERLGEAKKAKVAALDALRREESTNHTETLGEALHIKTVLRDCPPEELEDLRTRLKARIRSLIEEIWVLVEGTRVKKWATVQIFFRKGRWLRFTQHQQMGAHSLVGWGGPNEKLRPEDDLRQWRHQDPRRTFPCPEPNKPLSYWLEQASIDPPKGPSNKR